MTNTAKGNLRHITLIISLLSIASSIFYFGSQVAKLAYSFGVVTQQHQQIIDLINNRCR